MDEMIARWSKSTRRTKNDVAVIDMGRGAFLLSYANINAMLKFDSREDAIAEGARWADRVGATRRLL